MLHWNHVMDFVLSYTIVVISNAAYTKLSFVYCQLGTHPLARRNLGSLSSFKVSWKLTLCILRNQSTFLTATSQTSGRMCNHGEQNIFFIRWTNQKRLLSALIQHHVIWFHFEILLSNGCTYNFRHDASFLSAVVLRCLWQASWSTCFALSQRRQDGFVGRRF